MDKPTDLSNSSASSMASSDDGVVGQAKIDANNKNDALMPMPSHTSSGSNNNSKHSTLLGCGPLSSSASKLGNNVLAATKVPSSVAAAKIPLPLGAPLPNVASSTTSSTSTLQQTAATETTTATMPRFVSTSAMAASSAAVVTQQQQPINLNIKTTTGGNFDVTVDPNISVENLKKIIAKKLKVAKDRIRLLHRERELQDGSLKDNSLMDGSKIILIPNVETGLLAQRPENTVMQALESLNDSQVNDFLSGKTPLNLSMRLGDHMMLIQLQLSTVNPANSATTSANSHSASGTNCSSSRARASSQRTARFGSVSSVSSNGSNHHHHHHHHHHRSSLQQQQQSTNNSLSASSSSSSLASSVSTSSSHISLSSVSSSSSMSAATTSTANIASTTQQAQQTASLKPSLIKGSDLSSFLSKRDYESLQNIVKSFAMSQPARLAASGNSNGTLTTTSSSSSTINNVMSTTQVPTVSNQRYSLARSPSLKPVKQNSCFPVDSTSNTNEGAMLEQSPIKSLSNLVSSSAIENMAIKNIPTTSTNSGSNTTSNSGVQPASSVTPMITCQDPIAAKLTSCLCTRLNATAKPSNAIAIKNCVESSCLSRQDVAMAPAQQQQQQQPQQQQRTALALTSSSKLNSSAANNAPATTALLHKTANNPIVRSKHRHHHHHHHHHHHYHHQQNGPGVLSGTSTTTLAVRQKLPGIARTISLASNTVATAATQHTTTNPTNISNASNDSGFASDDSMLGNSLNGSTANASNTTTAPATTVAAAATQTPAAAQRIDLDDTGFISTDTRTLAEASRNLTQTLRKLSKEVFTNKIELANGDDAPRKGGSGAVIESMKNHGKGIYSGTFSGTLNPALQDRYGRPKRDISTVIHILNDLLSATPQYSRGARISFESPSSSSNVSGSNSAANSASNSSRSKQLSNKHHGNSHTHCLKCFKASVHGQHAAANSGTNTSSSGSSANCAYGECNGHYTSSNAASTSTKSASAARTSHYACCSTSTHNVNSSTGVSQPHQQPHHHHHQHQHNHTMDGNDRSVCSCRYRVQADGETGEQEREHTCQKCLSEMENLRTKSKLDQLRLVMQQRKQKREARKLNSAPYGARVVATPSNVNTELNETTTSAATVLASPLNASNANTTASKSMASNNATAAALTTAPPSEVSPNHQIVEEVDTAA